MRALALSITAMLLLTAAGTAPDLAAYVGKEPFEPVRGVTFFRHPTVTRAVGAAVGNTSLAREILSPSGPSGMVEATAIGFKADGCEAHNCGDHHWTLEVARSGKSATVCYHDAATMGPKARWYAWQAVGDAAGHLLRAGLTGLRACRGGVAKPGRLV